MFSTIGTSRRRSNLGSAQALVGVPRWGTAKAGPGGHLPFFFSIRTERKVPLRSDSKQRG
jgi:hypothetical protein